MAVAGSNSLKNQYSALCAIKLDSAMLLSHRACGSPDDPVGIMQPARIQEVDCITNEIVLELHHFKDKHQCNYKDLHCWLRDLYGMKWPSSPVP